jgi:2-phosphosulfolactate phosphatase
MSYFSQARFSVRLEWGHAAVAQLAGDVECVVVVDVMSFSTCVSIGIDRDVLVYPYSWRDQTAVAYAGQLDAVLAGDRRSTAEYSLSPASMLAAPPGLRLVLPSPNGAMASLKAQRGGAVFCACLRNLHATVMAVRRFATVLVVPCGERWMDDGLRPSVEDYIAAGGIVAGLARDNPSPEARVAALAFGGLGEQRRLALSECSSALELVERGFGPDVQLCLEEDVSSRACRLQDGCFRAVTDG